MSNIESWSQKPLETKEKMEKLFGHCFEITKFEEGDKIPVGGKSIFSSEADIKIIGDFESFKNFFEEVSEAANKFNLPNLKEWLASQKIKIDERIFAKLVAFTKKLEQKYPPNPNREQDRKKLYNEKSNGLKLSEVLDANSAACAEIAALAQGYLQTENISSTYFSGDVLWNKDEEFSEEHSFIIIRQNETVYLYDPTNPIKTDQGKFPSIYVTETNFNDEVRKNKKIFITSKNILSKEEAFYGVNDGTNVLPENII